MTFQITGLPKAPFEPLFDLDDAALRAHRAVRVIANARSGFPCRVSLKDAQPGEELILVNLVHQAADSPFHASHAVYVRRDAEEARLAPGEAPALFRTRTLSLRAFDVAGMMVDADLAEGAAVESLIERLLADPQVDYIHIHYAKPGCYAARVDRA